MFFFKLLTGFHDWLDMIFERKKRVKEGLDIFAKTAGMMEFISIKKKVVGGARFGGRISRIHFGVHSVWDINEQNWEEVWTSNINLGVISLQRAFKGMGVDGITKSLNGEQNKIKD